MLYYKNVLNGELAGLTESPVELNCENFFLIDEEEYVQLGGVITPKIVLGAEEETSDGSLSDQLINALVD